MNKEIELNSLHQQLQTKQDNINFYHTENANLQSDYDLGISRTKQLERELIDVLHYKKKIMEKMEVAESYASGDGSRLGSLKLVQPGQLEGRFLERMQSRIAERQRKQSNAVEMIKENVEEIKGKSKLIEEEIEDARKHVMEMDNLISTNQMKIQAKKAEITQLQGNIRMMT